MKPRYCITNITGVILESKWET